MLRFGSAPAADPTAFEFTAPVYSVTVEAPSMLNGGVRFSAGQAATEAAAYDLARWAVNGLFSSAQPETVDYQNTACFVRVRKVTDSYWRGKTIAKIDVI